MRRTFFIVGLLTWILAFIPPAPLETQVKPPLIQPIVVAVAAPSAVAASSLTAAQLDSLLQAQGFVPATTRGTQNYVAAARPLALDKQAAAAAVSAGLASSNTAIPAIGGGSVTPVAKPTVGYAIHYTRPAGIVQFASGEYQFQSAAKVTVVLLFNPVTVEIANNQVVSLN